MTIVAIRHLPTPWNIEERLQGRADIDILPPDPAEISIISKNREQLNTLGPFEKVFCSSLKRTRSTAELYGFRECTSDPLLDEFDFGKYEGALRCEFMRDLGETWINSPESIVLGESISDFEKRISQFLHKCRSLQRILVFTHGGWVRGLKSIHETGGIKCMNKCHVRNNEVLVFDWPG